jgi:hypothetical protein
VAEPPFEARAVGERGQSVCVGRVEQACPTVHSQPTAYIKPAEPTPARPVAVEGQGEAGQFVELAGRERARELRAERRPVHRFERQ